MAWAGEATGKTKHVSNKIFFIKTSKLFLPQRAQRKTIIYWDIQDFQD